jgi:uncharacterized membrane protein YsdA (DUF1294 family)
MPAWTSVGVSLFRAIGPFRLFLLGVYLGLSALSIVMYGADKRAAQSGAARRRTPESTLHVIALLGGWPGALLAQRIFRHKTRKQPFRTIFWCTVAANCALLAWLLVALPPA